ncbi:branched-chain amino acid ABC transporter permease [Chelatococcus reniformis]|uniref:Branched-chain amino acid ABC transporter permease n=1 Tax=Chelatococcus reniformis TaxID=1494448 RepID=A0A916TW79_9HYPH|nr:branched-chain amino acid ABC transporter permease [Chelatococcus reniformis]GGC44888.1 branched-chain amino acid ABC transporter permease [Chelatococcus reniformis]
MGHFLLRHQTPMLLAVLLVLIAGATSLSSNEALQVTLTEMFIRVIVVVGLYVFIGNSGIISFGHIGFMCIGAYAAAWATAEPSFKQIMLSGLPAFLQEHQYPFLVATAGALLLAMAVAFVLGLAIMRLSGTAASIATFAFLIIVNSVYSNWDSLTAGVSSIIGIPTVVGSFTAYAFAALAILVAYLFQISRFGLMLRASRDDEVAARASAVKIMRVRLAAFVLSAGLVGIGGGLYAQFLGILTVDPFYLNLSFITIAMLVVGGMASLSGAVVGVVAVTAIVEILRLFERGVPIGGASLGLPQGSQEIGLGIVMALILIFRPNGLSRGREFAHFAGAPLPAPSTAAPVAPPASAPAARPEGIPITDERKAIV